jgi:3-methyladenine DNA glycosylase AlkC
VYELKQHKTWSNEECSQFLEKRKQDKMQWLQDSNQSNLDNIYHRRSEANRHFMVKKEGISESYN